MDRVCTGFFFIVGLSACGAAEQAHFAPANRDGEPPSEDSRVVERVIDNRLALPEGSPVQRSAPQSVAEAPGVWFAVAPDGARCGLVLLEMGPDGTGRVSPASQCPEALRRMRRWRAPTADVAAIELLGADGDAGWLFERGAQGTYRSGSGWLLLTAPSGAPAAP